MRTSKQCNRRAFGQAILSGQVGLIDRLLPIGLALALAASILAGDGVSFARAPAPAASPIADWIDDVVDDIDETEDGLEDAAAAVGGSEGPLVDPELSIAAAGLDTALAAIDRILDPDQYPSLDPPDAGSVDLRIDPQSLPEYAQTCLSLVRDARDELGSTVVDHKVLGTHLRTIRHLITRQSPHGYRSLAGVSEG